MVHFGKHEDRDFFAINVEGDREQYIETMRSILHYLTSISDDLEYPKERYYLCRLLDGMLPDPSQVMSYEDVILLERIKSKKGGIL